MDVGYNKRFSLAAAGRPTISNWTIKAHSTEMACRDRVVVEGVVNRKSTRCSRQWLCTSHPVKTKFSVLTSVCILRLFKLYN